MRRERDHAYYRDRAEAELESARGATNPIASRAHFILAGFYFDRAFRIADEPVETSPPQVTARI